MWVAVMAAVPIPERVTGGLVPTTARPRRPLPLTTARAILALVVTARWVPPSPLHLLTPISGGLQ